LIQRINLRDYLLVNEAAEFVGVSEGTLRNWGQQGKISTHRHPINGYCLYKQIGCCCAIALVANYREEVMVAGISRGIWHAGRIPDPMEAAKNRKKRTLVPSGWRIMSVAQACRPKLEKILDQATT
jgi:hypothetical protein